MTEISLHVLDLVQNSVEAGASRVEVGLMEDAQRDVVEVVVEDNGRGMSEEAVRAACDPFFTTRSSRDVGLGLPLTRQNAEATGGTLEVASREGKGTRVTVRFGRSHVDRPPLGSISSTLVAIGAVNPGLDLVYRHVVRGTGAGAGPEGRDRVFCFSTALLARGADPSHGYGPMAGFDPPGLDNPACAVAFGEWVRSHLRAIGSEGA